jgi:hypothetical protein
MVRRCFVALVLFSVPALADPPAIKGTVGFDWLKPEKSRCTAVAGALLTKLTKDYTCVTPAKDHESLSGVTLVAACKAKKGDSEYLLFSTTKDCVKEREMQLANGE